MMQENKQIAGVFVALIYILPKYYDKGIPKGGIISVADVYTDLKERIRYDNPGDVALFNIIENNLESIKSYTISNPGWLYDDIPGTPACTFSDSRGHYYIVFQGTSDGEWPDNSVAFNGEESIQQQRALKYYERVIAYHNIKDEDEVIVAGHSKGGNKAQYITLNSVNRKLVDRCYSFDGQGFSKEAMDKIRQNDDFYIQQQKLYGIDGENDYVHNLGNELAIPDEHREVIPTIRATEFSNFHEFQYMFQWNGDQKPGQLWSLKDAYGDEGNPKTTFSDLSKRLSVRLSQLPKDQQESCARAIMQLLEMVDGGMLAINGDNATSQDYGVLFKHGLPIIIETLREDDEAVELLTNGKFTSEQLNQLLENYFGKVIFQFIDDVEPETAGIAVKSLMDYFTEKGKLGNFDFKEYWFSLSIDEKMAIASILNKGVHAAGKEGLREATVGDVLIASGVTVAAISNPATAFIAGELAGTVITFETAVWTWDHRDELEAMINNAVGKIVSACEFVKANIKEHIQNRINLCADLCQGICNATGIVINFVDNIAGNLQTVGWHTIATVASTKAGVLLTGPYAPVVYQFVKNSGYHNPIRIQYNLLQLENLSGRLLQLASEVNSLDSSLSSLYGKLLIRDIEQGENIFTCLADMFHLVRADIVVDSGWMVRNECQRLSRAVQELHAMKNELR